MKRIVGGVAALAMLLGGCGSSGGNSGSSVSTTTPAANTSASNPSASGQEASADSAGDAPISATGSSGDLATTTDVSTSAAGKPFAAAGTVVITGSSNFAIENMIGCTGAADFAGAKTGAKVTVSTAKGEVIDFAELGMGAANTNPDRCVFSWTVDSIPSGEGPYVAELGDIGKVPFKEPTGGREAITVTIDLP